MSFDLARALRRHKPERRTTAITKRPDDELPYVQTSPEIGRSLLLDTSVYIDAMQGRTSDSLDRLLRLRLLHHSSVCLSELTHLFGRLDPEDARTAAVLRSVSQTVSDIPAHRLSVPSVQVAAEAGILAGLVARLTGIQAARRQALLNDALIYMQALEGGHVVLTRNVRDFDLFDQLQPNGSVLFYRTA